MLTRLRHDDPTVAAIVTGERMRQKDGIELIASENYVSSAVLEALGTVFTNKYSEGYPGKRYYGGQEYTDHVEQCAIDRAKKLFDAEHVNVQPLSGAPANLAVYSALLNPGDTVLGMDLSHGGHLTHGHPVTLSAKIYKFIRYKTLPDGTIDYAALAETARAAKPKIILAGFSSYSRQIDYAKFRAIADDVGAVFMMDMAHIAGLVAGKVLPNPVPLCDVVTTTTHKTLRGPRGGMILCKEKYAAAIDKAVFPGLQGGPHMNNIAALAVALGEALKPAFRTYARQTLKNAVALAKELTKKKFVLCFGGITENHMLLVDMIASRGISDKEAQIALDAVGLSTNKNVIPDDQRSPMDPSGLRIGVPAATTRGMKEKEMRAIAHIIDEALAARGNDVVMKRLRRDVVAVCRAFPLPY